MPSPPQGEVTAVATAPAFVLTTAAGHLGPRRYVILNFAIGGPWPAPPDASTVFPVETLVDYVRVSTKA